MRAVGEEGTDKHIAAFVVFEKDASVENAPRAARAELKAALPHYMVPSFVVPMDELPTDPISGKLDGKALPKTIPDLLAFVEAKRAGGAGGSAASAASAGFELRTPTEVAVGAVWADVLEVRTAVCRRRISHLFTNEA